jgi:hypothetical protein
MDMTDASSPGTAIYLVGHGPYREPRLIELQYQRILRYRRIVREKYETGYPEAAVFVDLNYPRTESRGYELTSFPAFVQLCRAVKQKQFGVVYLDLEVGTSFAPYAFSFVQSTLEECGAKVLNAFYDEDKALAEELRDKFGPDADTLYIDDGSDFVNFFPALAAEVTVTALRDELSERPARNAEVSAIEHRIHRLSESSPYSSSGMPFVEDRLREQWLRRRAERERTLNDERRKHEPLYRLGPNHVGFLIDERVGWSHEGPRNEEQFQWAENRVCAELHFQKRTAGQFVSYERTVDRSRIFADIRTHDRITFYVYEAEEGKSRRQDLGVGSKSFSIQDRWKNDLEAKWLEALRRTLGEFS